MADLAGYDVDDDDDIYAPAAGRYGLDPRLEKFAKLVAEYALRYERLDMYTKSKNVNISEKHVQETDISIHEQSQNILDVAERAYFAGKKDGIDETIALIRSKNDKNNT
jgi:hypothetical protein